MDDIVTITLRGEAVTGSTKTLSNMAWEAQVDYCNKHQYPVFCSTRCWSCGAWIPGQQDMGSKLVTGCNKCCRSFVE